MAVIRVERVAGVASVQDLGRPGLRHRGIPPGGTLVPDQLVAANLACGNPPEVAGIEWIGRLVLELPDGALATFEAPAGVGALAVPGGIQTPEVGRRIRSGDELAIGASAGPVRAALWTPPDRAARVLRGPDEVPGAWEALLSGAWAVGPASDRVGQRLVGPPMPTGVVLRSAPMTRGAIQLLPDGGLVALGPDHPITGGYPVIAVIATADWGLVGGAHPGAKLEFTARGAA
jgi:allophanate hydrolase subunit 2